MELFASYEDWADAQRGDGDPMASIDPWMVASMPTNDIEVPF